MLPAAANRPTLAVRLYYTAFVSLAFVRTLVGSERKKEDGPTPGGDGGVGRGMFSALW